MKMIMPLMKNLKREQDLGGFHTMNWLMLQMISTIKKKLGQGGFGGVYRGFLRDLDSIVAIKRVSEGSRQGIKEYVLEVKIISQLRHKNLVQLF